MKSDNEVYHTVKFIVQRYSEVITLCGLERKFKDMSGVHSEWYCVGKSIISCEKRYLVLLLREKFVASRR